MKTILICLFFVSQSAFAEMTVGIKNYREMYESLIVQTGVVPAAGSTIDSYYQSAVTRLPKDGNVQEFSSPMLITYTALVGMFCQQFIANEAKLPADQRRAHSKVDFKVTNLAQITDTVRQSIVADYAALFWLRSPGDDEMATLLSSMKASEGITGLTLSGMLLMACTSMGSSLASMVN